MARQTNDRSFPSAPRAAGAMGQAAAMSVLQLTRSFSSAAKKPSISTLGSNNLIGMNLG